MADLKMYGNRPLESDVEQARTRHLDDVLTFVAILVTGFIVAWIYHYLRGFHLGYPYPESSFLFIPPDGGGDFFRSLMAIRSSEVYDVPETFYFPFTYVLLRPLGVLRDRQAQAVFLAIFSTTALWFVWRQLSYLRNSLRLLITVAAVGLNYAFLFALDRSNLEALVFVFLVLHIVTLRSEHKLASVMFLAAATAMKLYPGIFVVLFIARRWYREAALTAGLSLALVLGSAAMIEGGIFGSLGALAEQLRTTLVDRYLLGDAGLQFSSGLYSALRLALIKLDLDTRPLLASLQLPYTVFGLAVGAITAWYVIRIERELWKQVALLTLVFILIPQVSYDYRLIHLLLPLGLYFARGFEGDQTPGWGRAYAVLFALVLIPKAYHVFGVPEGRDIGLFFAINFSVVLNPLIMLALAATLVADRMRRRPEAAQTPTADSPPLTTTSGRR